MQSLFFYDLLSKFANVPDQGQTCIPRVKILSDFASDDQHTLKGTFQTSTFFQMHAMGGSRGGTGGPDPPPPLIGFPSNIDPDLLNITMLPSQHSMVGHYGQWRFADGGPFLVAFRSSLTIPSDKMFWIRACMQCV